MSDTELRWQLRQLPRELEPARDLWPDIARGLSARATHVAPRIRARIAFLVSALAASVLVALSLLNLASHPFSSNAAVAPLVQVEADALTQEFDGAIRELSVLPSASVNLPELRLLDQSAAQIRRAMQSQPDSINLLSALRNTYWRRLRLTQRAFQS